MMAMTPLEEEADAAPPLPSSPSSDAQSAAPTSSSPTVAAAAGTAWPRAYSSALGKSVKAMMWRRRNGEGDDSDQQQEQQQQQEQSDERALQRLLLAIESNEPQEMLAAVAEHPVALRQSSEVSCLLAFESAGMRWLTFLPPFSVQWLLGGRSATAALSVRAGAQLPLRRRHRRDGECLRGERRVHGQGAVVAFYGCGGGGRRVPLWSCVNSSLMCAGWEDWWSDAAARALPEPERDEPSDRTASGGVPGEHRDGRQAHEPASALHVREWRL